MDLPELLKSYNDKDIYNFDETGLFVKLLPDKTYAVQNTELVGTKKIKERISILFGVNMCGERTPMLVIGKSKNPRSFKNKIFDRNKIIYKSNSTAWMTTEIFEEYFREMSTLIQKENRNIVVLLDNCSAHKIQNLSNINFIFLPPNTTSLIQPLDQDIIRDFKLKYRQTFLYSIFDNDLIRLKQNLKNFTLYNAIEHALLAWDNVKATTIVNCFQKLFRYASPDKFGIVNQNEDTEACEKIYSKFADNSKSLDNYIVIDSKESLEILNAAQFAEDVVNKESDLRIVHNYEDDNSKLVQLKKIIVDAKNQANSVSTYVENELFKLEIFLNEIINKDS